MATIHQVSQLVIMLINDIVIIADFCLLQRLSEELNTCGIWLLRTEAEFGELLWNLVIGD